MVRVGTERLGDRQIFEFQILITVKYSDPARQSTLNPRQSTLAKSSRSPDSPVRL